MSRFINVLQSDTDFQADHQKQNVAVSNKKSSVRKRKAWNNLSDLKWVQYDPVMWYGFTSWGRFGSSGPVVEDRGVCAPSFTWFSEEGLDNPVELSGGKINKTTINPKLWNLELIWFCGDFFKGDILCKIPFFSVCAHKYKCVYLWSLSFLVRLFLKYGFLFSWCLFCIVNTWIV